MALNVFAFSQLTSVNERIRPSAPALQFNFFDMCEEKAISPKCPELKSKLILHFRRVT